MLTEGYLSDLKVQNICIVLIFFPSLTMASELFIHGDNEGGQTHILRPCIDHDEIGVGVRIHCIPQGIGIEKPWEDLLREIDNALAYNA